MLATSLQQGCNKDPGLACNKDPGLAKDACNKLATRMQQGSWISLQQGSWISQGRLQQAFMLRNISVLRTLPIFTHCIGMGGFTCIMSM